MIKKMFYTILALTLFLLVMYPFMVFLEPDNPANDASARTYAVTGTESKPLTLVSFHEEDQCTELGRIQSMKQARMRVEQPVIKQMLDDERAYKAQRQNWERIIDNKLVEGYDPEYDKEWNLDLYR